KVNHLQRLESLGMLAGGIAHDFNNLLTIIRGNAELSMISGAMSPEVKKFQLEIIAATDRASKLTAQMLSYAGEGRIELKTIDISREIEELLPLIRSSISSEHVIKLDLKPDIMVECDLSQVQQVVLNTVVNASEAIVEGNGEISIACYKAKLPAGSEKGFVYLPEERGPHYVCIEIGDNGTGIPENMLAKVCDPFFSTKFTGRGLGMAAALGIIKRHNGALHIESVLQSGTTFRYYLPQNEKVLQKPIDNSPTDKDEEPFHGTALITEDEPIIRRLMENFLQNLGFDVVCVENGLEGVKFLKKNPENLALAIIDMVMPEMNGKDFYMLLRRRFTEVPVVFCSGYSFEFVPEEIRHDPNAAFVQKPFSWKSIEKEIFRLYKR
ncbi:MAG: hybrid sensor histidine kinase/response regulator, partial [Candidatus Rifleibacteriota bacterium]